MSAGGRGGRKGRGQRVSTGVTPLGQGIRYLQDCIPSNRGLCRPLQAPVHPAFDTSPPPACLPHPPASGSRPWRSSRSCGGGPAGSWRSSSITLAAGGGGRTGILAPRGERGPWLSHCAKAEGYSALACGVLTGSRSQLLWAPPWDDEGPAPAPTGTGKGRRLSNPLCNMHAQASWLGLQATVHAQQAAPTHLFGCPAGRCRCWWLGPRPTRGTAPGKLLLAAPPALLGQAPPRRAQWPPAALARDSGRRRGSCLAGAVGAKGGRTRRQSTWGKRVWELERGRARTVWGRRCVGE